MSGETIFRDGFCPLLADCFGIPFNDLGALEQALAPRRMADFIVETIPGQGVKVPDEGYLAGGLISTTNMEPCSLLTKSRPGSAAQAVFWRSITGASNLT
jgi:hypothetical protein